MKKVCALLLILTSCQGSKKEDPEEGGPDLGVAYATQLSYDVSKIQVGQWVRYAVHRKKDPNPRAVKFSAVAGDREHVWIENKVPGTPGPYVIKSKYSRTGKLLEQWVGRPGTDKVAKVFPREDGKSPDSAAIAPPPISMQETQEKIEVAGRSFSCVKITTTFKSKGRDSVMVNWCAKEIPFQVRARRRTYGGVAKRTIDDWTMELASFGTDAKAELTLPKR